MPAPRVMVLRAPGTNCDLETAHTFERAGAIAERVHVQRLLEAPQRAAEFQILCLPGGFSYGDDLAAGRILGAQFRNHLADAMQEFRARGGLILGICNGFQILLKSGLLLPDDPVHGPPATLTLNDSGRYEDRWVHLAVEAGECVFLRGIESMYLPVAHAEGKFVPRDAAALEQLERGGQLVLRYAAHETVGLATVQSARGSLGAAIGGAVSVASGAAVAELPYPMNPNGAVGNIAGVCDATGRVLGLMPHPERHTERTHHPRWTRGEGRDGGEGLRLFQNAVEHFA